MPYDMRTSLSQTVRSTIIAKCEQQIAGWLSTPHFHSVRSAL